MIPKTYANVDLRQKAKAEDVTFWQIANFLGVCEMTISRRFRFELSDQEKTAMSFIIDKIAAEKNGADVSEAEKARVIRDLLNAEPARKKESASC